MKSRLTCHRAVSPKITPYCGLLICCLLHYLVALHSALSLNSGIVTLILHETCTLSKKILQNSMFSKPVVFQTGDQLCNMHEKIYLNISLSWPNMWVTKVKMSSGSGISTAWNTCHMLICDMIYRQMKMFWLLKRKHDKNMMHMTQV